MTDKITTKRYILVMCDTSDFDGFMAIPLYYKAAIEGDYELVFVMTSPSFFDKDNTNNNNEFGLGVGNGIKNWGQNTDNFILTQLALYNSTKHMIETILNRCKILFPGITVNCHHAYNNKSYNSINPFKNPLNETIPLNLIRPDIEEGGSIIIPIIKMDEFISDNVEILMVMNGSMAWFDGGIFFNNQPNKTHFCNNIKKCFIVGGVLDGFVVEKDNSTFNTLLAANKNQIFHPNATSEFFTTNPTGSKLVFISNNEVDANFSFGNNGDNESYYKFKMHMKLTGLIPYDEDDNICKWFDYYYKNFNRNKKPADVIAALYLFDFIENSIENNIDKNYFARFHPIYGSLFLSKSKTFTNNAIDEKEKEIYNQTIVALSNMNNVNITKPRHKYNYLESIYNILIGDTKTNFLHIHFKSTGLNPTEYNKVSSVKTKNGGNGQQKSAAVRKIIRTQFIKKKERKVYKIKGSGNTLYVDINRKRVKLSSIV